MSDIYLYEDVPVLKNKLDIRDEKTLDLIEAEQSRESKRATRAAELENLDPEKAAKVRAALERTKKAAEATETTEAAAEDDEPAAQASEEASSDDSSDEE